MTSLQISVITPFVGKQVCRLVFEEVLTIATSWNHWLVTGCGLWSLPSHSAMRLSSSDRVPTKPPSGAIMHWLRPGINGINKKVRLSYLTAIEESLLSSNTNPNQDVMDKKYGRLVSGHHIWFAPQSVQIKSSLSLKLKFICKWIPAGLSSFKKMSSKQFWRAKLINAPLLSYHWLPLSNLWVT